MTILDAEDQLEPQVDDNLKAEDEAIDEVHCYQFDVKVGLLT
jgi:hypothetical protein